MSIVIQKCDDDHSLYSLSMAGTKNVPGPHEVAANIMLAYVEMVPLFYCLRSIVFILSITFCPLSLLQYQKE